MSAAVEKERKHKRKSIAILQYNAGRHITDTGIRTATFYSLVRVHNKIDAIMQLLVFTVPC